MLDRVQNEEMRVILGTTKDTTTETMRFMLDLQPMQTREKVEQVKPKFSAVENPRNPLHEVVKDTKGYRVELGKSSSIASVPADRVQAKQGMEKVPKPIPASPSPRDTLTREFGKALLRMASRQNEVSDQVFYSRKQQTARPHSVH